jgi:hypothetical protein
MLRRSTSWKQAGDAFYEWKVVENGKQPYAIARQDG